jgi:hypothetical protein
MPVACTEPGMRVDTTLLLTFGAMLLATSASAYDAYDSKGLFANPMFRPAPQAPASDVPNDPGNCVGVEWDEKHPLTLAKITASPRVNFVKSRYDDMFKVSTCPAATDACRKKSYLVPGDLVLVGKTQGDFTCVAYQQPATKRPSFTEGWLPSTALTKIAPAASTARSDWIGTWEHPHGTIEIKEGGIGGRLQIDGFALVPTAHDFRNGAILAQVMPTKDSIAFMEDGWMPFETVCEDACKVRMQRVGPYLLVEDSRHCGGLGVTFTGLYRRK